MKGLPENLYMILGRNCIENNNVYVKNVYEKVSGLGEVIGSVVMNVIDRWYKCFVVKELPENLDMILGRNCIENNNYYVKKIQYKEWYHESVKL